MAWEKVKVEHQRLQFVTALLRKEASMTQLCKHYGISRKTGYKWYNIYLKHGQKGLQDSPRAPLNRHYFYSQDQIDTALDLKLRYRTWGPKKISAKLKELYPEHEWPSPTRLYQIFQDYHLVTSRRLRSRVPATAPLGHLENCNDTWAIDFKGWFLTQDGHKFQPLTLTDCFSRYLIRCDYLKKHSVEYVWPILMEAFYEYGLPQRMRSDNGPPFGSLGVGRLTRLSVNLIKAGVIPEWIKPGHPEQNGRHERLHLTLKQEIAAPPRENLILQIDEMKRFHFDYNFERPHEALGMKTPGSIYQLSPREWNGILKSPEYDNNFQVRKVCPNGCIWVKQQEYFIGNALVGEYVGLKPNDSEELELHYGPVYLGKLNSKNEFEKPKMRTRYRIIC